MDLSEFMPSVAAEADQSHIETVEDAAISRLRGGAVTGSSAPAPGLAQTMFRTGRDGVYTKTFTIGTDNAIWLMVQGPKGLQGGAYASPPPGGLGRRWWYPTGLSRVNV
jgi:hypothetical protein